MASHSLCCDACPPLLFSPPGHGLATPRCSSEVLDMTADKPVWSKYPNASCYRYLQAMLGQVESTSTAITVNVKQHLYQPIGNRFIVLPIAQNALVIGKGKYGQTLRCVLVLDGECERFRAFIIAGSGE